MKFSIYDDEAFFAAYAQMSRSKDGLTAAGEWHQLEPLFPELAGTTVLDLGCGYGWHCKYAAEHGAASVLGIDLSERMIGTARQKNVHPVIEYRVCGIEAFDYPAGMYDLVISNLALHYLEDLNAVYGNVYKTLKSDGVFLFNIEHPTYTAGINEDWVYDGDGNALYWPVDRYYYPGPRNTVFLGQNVSKYHHTLTEILMGLIHAGLSIQAVEEAMPPEEWRDAMPEEMRRPMMLLVKAIKD